MNQTLKTILISALVAVVVVVGFVLLVGKQSGETNLGAAVGINRYPNSGVVARYFKISTATPQTAGTDGTFKVGASGTDISNYQCATATWNPGVINSTTTATTTVSLSGAVVGNLALGTFSAVSSSDVWIAEAKVTETGTTTIFLRALPTQTADLNLVTSTAKVCIIQ